MNALARLGYWTGTALAIVAFAVIALAAATALTACGGGDPIDCESETDRTQYPEQCMCDQPGQCT